MKKGIIIGGLVLVIGGVSYFLYMKEKKKKQGLIAENQPTDKNAGAPISTSAVVTPSATIISIEEQKKIDRVRDAFEEYKKYLKLSHFKQYLTIISKLKQELLELGYEINGGSNPVLVKLNALYSSTTFTSIEEQQKLDKARDIFEQIKAFIPLDRKLQYDIASFYTGRYSYEKPPSNPYPARINKLKGELLQLGYEVKGTTNIVLVKLNAL